MKRASVVSLAVLVSLTVPAVLLASKAVAPELGNDVPILRPDLSASTRPTRSPSVSREPEGGVTDPGSSMRGPGPITADYLIITTTSLKEPFERFAAWKRRHGVTADVRTLSWIRGRYPAAADDAERIRLAIRDAHARRTRWVLLGGDTELIPTRFVYLTGDQLPPRECESDFYFACLDGNWNADGDGHYGEASSSEAPGDEVDLEPEVYVGRAPARNPEEARNFVDKTIAYEEGSAGPVTDRMLFAAEVLYPKPWHPGDPITLDFARTVEQLLQDHFDRPFPTTRLYQNYTEPDYHSAALPENRASVLEHLGAGHPVSVLLGGGAADVISVGPDLLTAADVEELRDPSRLTNVLTISSFTHAIAQDCLAEAWLRAKGGAVSSLGSSTLTFAGIDGAFLREYFHLLQDEHVATVGELSSRHRLALGTTPGESPIRDYILSLILLGDPQLPLFPAPAPHHGPRARGILPEEASSTSRLALHEPEPNPARDHVSFTIEAAADGDRDLEITIFDLAGRRVRRIDGLHAIGGRVAASWDLKDDAGQRVGEGVYFVSVRSGGAKQIRRLLVVR